MNLFSTFDFHDLEVSAYDDRIDQVKDWLNGVVLASHQRKDRQLSDEEGDSANSLESITKDTIKSFPISD